ncbi:helix-turn-helix domain-containing protein [Halodesulfovibrio aestuarii]|uniref:Helix-turn-helix domain-containing protein n=1 Tax=Halodesulfovibrio aestuarii TaxID=126333 RepID=A0ABV4JTZ8_9BACT
MSELENVGCNRKKVCDYLGIGKSKYYELVDSGEFPNAYRCGNQFMVPFLDLLNFRERNRLFAPKDENKTA